MARQSIGAVSLAGKRLRCQRSCFKFRALGSFSRSHRRSQLLSTTEKSCTVRLRPPLPPISLLRNVTHQLQEGCLKPFGHGLLRFRKNPTAISSKKGRLIGKLPRLLARRPQIELKEKQRASSISLMEQQKEQSVRCRSDTPDISSVESVVCGNDGLHGYSKSEFILQASSVPSTTFSTSHLLVQPEELCSDPRNDHGDANKWDNDLGVSNGPLKIHLPERVREGSYTIPVESCLGGRRRGSSHRVQLAAKNMAYSSSKKRRLSKVLQPSDSCNSVNASRWSTYRGAQSMGPAPYALGAIPYMSEIHNHGPNPFGHTMSGANAGFLGRNAPYLGNGVGFLDNCRFCHRQILRKGQSRPRICLQCEKKKATPIHDRCKDCKEPIVRSNVRKARICQKCKKHREKARNVYPMGLSAAAMMPMSYSHGGTQACGNSNAGFLAGPAVTPLGSLVSPSFTIAHSSGVTQRLPTSLVNSRRIYAVNNYLYWLHVLSQTPPVVSPLCYGSAASLQTPQFNDHASHLSHSDSNTLQNKCLQFIAPANAENQSTITLQRCVMGNHSEDRSLGDHHLPFYSSPNVALPPDHTEGSTLLPPKESIHDIKESRIEDNSTTIRGDHLEAGRPNNSDHPVPRNVLLHISDQCNPQPACNSSTHTRNVISVTQDYRRGVQDFPNGQPDFVPCVASTTGHLIQTNYGSNLSNRGETLSHNFQHLNILAPQDTRIGRATGSALVPQLYSYLRKIATEDFSTPEDIVEHLRSRLKKSGNMTSVALYNVHSGSGVPEAPQEINGCSVGSTIGFKATGPILIPQINPYTLLHHLAVHEHRQQQEEHIRWKPVNQRQEHGIDLRQSQSFSGRPVEQAPHRSLAPRDCRTQYTQEKDEVEFHASNIHGRQPGALPSGSSSLALLGSPLLSTTPTHDVATETEGSPFKDQEVHNVDALGNVLNNGVYEAMLTSIPNTETSSPGHFVPHSSFNLNPLSEEFSASCTSSKLPVSKSMRHQEPQTNICETADHVSERSLASVPLGIARQRKRARCLSDASSSESCPSWFLAEHDGFEVFVKDSDTVTSSGSKFTLQKPDVKPDGCLPSLPKEKEFCDIVCVKPSGLGCLSSSRSSSLTVNQNDSFDHASLSLNTAMDEEYTDVCVASQSSGHELSPSCCQTQSEHSHSGGGIKTRNTFKDSCSNESSGVEVDLTSFKIRTNDVDSNEVSLDRPVWLANPQGVPANALCHASGISRSGSALAPLHLFAALFLSSLVGKSTASQDSTSTKVKQEKTLNDFSCNISDSASSKNSNTLGVNIVQLKQEKDEKNEEDVSFFSGSNTVSFSNPSSFSSMSAPCVPTANQESMDASITSSQHPASCSVHAQCGGFHAVELQRKCLAGSKANERFKSREEISQPPGSSKISEPYPLSSYASSAAAPISKRSISCVSNAAAPSQPVVFSTNGCGARKKRVLKGVSPRRLVVASSV